jgi:hypothetical protein
VWVFKGEVMGKNEQPTAATLGMQPAAEPEQPAPKKPRRAAAKTGAKRATASQT